MATMGPRALAEAVRQRRERLGLSQTELSSRGGVGVVTVGKIERGEIARPQASTLHRLDRALQWQDGSSAGVLQGQHPRELPQGERPPGTDVIEAIRNDPYLLPEAREHLERQYGLLLRVQAVAAVTARDEARDAAPMNPAPNDSTAAIERDMIADYEAHNSNSAALCADTPRRRRDD